MDLSKKMSCQILDEIEQIKREFCQRLSDDGFPTKVRCSKFTLCIINGEMFTFRRDFDLGGEQKWVVFEIRIKLGLEHIV